MELGRRQHELFRLLHPSRPLWQGRPFVSETLPWMEEHPAVARWLLALSPEQVSAFDADLSLLRRQAPEPLAGWAERVERVCLVEPVEVPRVRQLGPRLSWEVPLRKQRQVAAFAAAVAARMPAGLELLDWCAGKGYLGRALAGLYDREVACVETRGALCRRGEALDQRAGVSCRWHHADIHETAAHELLTGRAVVALHACGELHRELVLRAVQHEATTLAFAPCCYHRRVSGQRTTPSAARTPNTETGPLPPPPSAPPYRPLSATTRELDLQLDHHALLLPTSEEVVARPRHVRARRREQLYRLCLDRLLREATGQDRYVSMPPLPATWLRHPLDRFVDQINRAFGLTLTCAAPNALLSWAEDRLRRATTLALVRGLFRRPLELYLALDCALYLEQSGHTVTVETFCEKQVTPRNLFIFSRFP